MNYIYDPDTRRYVADLLYRALPEFYRNKDQPPNGRDELKHLLVVLGVPLAIARQSIEELHADFFIDTAGDWVLPYLAEMVGTRLVFPDADSNRRDIRSTIAFRRRKGTPRMLQDLGETLTGHMVVTQEGWKLVQMTQDLNLLRPERLVPDLRPAITAEIGEGPLNALHHVVDIRAISRTTGQFHPKHVFHWTHPTLLFPLEDGVPADLRDPATDPDFRWAFHPLGRRFPLRVQRADSSDREIRTDRTPPLHFDRSPGVWFGRTGRFSVRICGVTAGVAEPLAQGRLATRRLASSELLAGNPTLTVLEQDPRQFHGRVRVVLAAVTLAGDVADTITPGAVERRGGVQVSEDEVVAVAGIGGAPPAGSVAMILLEAVDPTAGAFPGLTIAIEGDVAAAGLASEDVALAQAGFLRGAFTVRLPAARIDGERWFYLAADGSVYEAQATGTGAADVGVPLEGGVRQAPAAALLVTGPGPAWPPLPPAVSPTPLVALPNAPNRGPTVQHGGRVLDAGLAEVGAGVRSALTFALRIGIFGPATLHPFLRLQWNGPDPSAATWTAIADDVSPTPLDPRLAEIAQLRDENPDTFRLVVRAESEEVNARLSPSEVAWIAYDGDATLIHLPELSIQNGTLEPDWPLGAGLNGASEAVAIASDGSVWNVFFSERRRQSLGAVAPIRDRVDLRRRQVRYRHLCPWINENPGLGEMLAATAPGRLDIDPVYGLFSMAEEDPPQVLPVGPDGAPPPANVTVMYQDGYSDHIGARPAAREPLLDQRLNQPTRLVSGSGHLRSNAPREWHDLPRFRTLGEALAAIAADPTPAGTEVIEFQDSATYTNEIIDWPANVTRLIVQAAERERPVVQVQNWTIAAGAAYEELILTGLLIGGEGIGALALPPAAAIRIEFCTVSHPENELQFVLVGAEVDRVHIIRSLTAGLQLDGSGLLEISDTVVDAEDNPAITANEGRLKLDQVTVLGTVTTFIIDASETIFDDDVTVQDRFQGCVRYSRVTGTSVLPQVHRVAVDIPVQFVPANKHDRYNPAHGRLVANTDRAVLRGAEDGGEMGAFHELRLAQRYEGYRRRLDESTPAGLMTGIIQMD